MKVLIDKIPDSSTYVIPFLFFDNLDDVFPQRVQVEDMRWSMKRIEQIIQADLENDFGRMLEIKDAQYSQVDREILRSICIYRPKYQFKDTWERYYNYLKLQIYNFANEEEYASQQLRCYVGDSVWDILHRDGVLKASHVDFIRMADSSDYSWAGLEWRSLAYDDWDYKCVYMADTDVKFVELGSSQLSDVFPSVEWDTYDFVSFPMMMAGGMPFKRYSQLFVFSNCSRTVRLNDISLFRGSKQIPFLKMPQLLQAVWKCALEQYKIYDPERDMWTFVSTFPHRSKYLLGHLGHIAFYLSKHLNTKIKINKRSDGKIGASIKALDYNDFSKRLARQVWGYNEMWSEQ